MLKIVFWTAVAIVAYIYFGYPLFLTLWSMFKRQDRERREIFPRVTLIISAHNEEQIIKKKIENSLELSYPKDKLEIIVVSDGSTDNTDGIAKRYSCEFDNVKLVRVGGRIGKNIALNKVLPHVSGDIMVFSDANSMYKGDAIESLVKYFDKKEIGCVVGRLRYVNTDSSNVSQGEGLYWKYESFIKRLESRLGLLLVGNGSIFAIRKELYSPLEPDVPNDLQTPLEIGHRGYQVIYEPRAVAIEKAAISSREEFRKKVRIINRGLMGFLRLGKKVKGWRLFGFISHKLLRWLAGVFLILIFLSNIFLVGFNLYRILFLFQLLFYGLAGIGTYFQWRRIRCGIFCVPFYFFLINLASFVALFEFLLGKRYFIWEKASTKEQIQNM